MSSEREKRLVDVCGEYASIAKLASSSGVPATRLYEMSRSGALIKLGSKVSVRAFARLLDAIDDGVASRSGDMVASVLTPAPDYRKPVVLPAKQSATPPDQAKPMPERVWRIP